MIENEYPTLEGFSPKQVHAIPLIASGQKQTIVAKTVGIDQRTLSQWMQRPDFREAVQLEQRALVAEVRGRLRSLGLKAVETIEAVMNDPEAPSTAKLKAASMILQSLAVIDLAMPEPEQKSVGERMAEFNDDAILAAITRAKAAKQDAKALQPNVQ